MKKLILLSTLTFLAACSSQNTTAPTAQPTSSTTQANKTTTSKKLEKILSKDNSYSLKIPAEWSNLTSDEDVDIELHYLDDQGSIMTTSLPKTETGSLSLKDVSKISFKTILSDSDADISNIEYKDTLVAGYKAVMSPNNKVAEQKNDDTYENAILYMVETPSKYIVIFVGHDNDSKVSLTEIEEILNTLTIEKE